MINTLARCERTNEYEEWNSYIKEATGIRINKVLVFFSAEEIKLILLVCQESDLSDKDYLSDVMQLVHDLPLGFEFITEFVEKENYDTRTEELKASFL